MPIIFKLCKLRNSKTVVKNRKEYRRNTQQSFGGKHHEELRNEEKQVLLPAVLKIFRAMSEILPFHIFLHLINFSTFEGEPRI
jgi:hypothetical protein